MISGFKTIRTKNSELDRVQSNVQLFSNELTTNPLLDGVLLKDIDLTTTETLVNHTLGRLPQGWIIIKKDAAQDVYESGTTLQQRFLSLTAGGAVTVSLWVF